MTPLTDFFTLLSPCLCQNCGRRLTETEQTFCSICNGNLPRTTLYLSPEDNDLTNLFARRLPVAKATAFIYYQPAADSCHFVYQMKYYKQSQVATEMGRMMGHELADKGFFNDIDALVPVPLAPVREHQRGYNQSLLLAEGVSEITGIPVYDDIIRRTHFLGSQTQLNHIEREENVADAFLLNPDSPHIRQGKVAGRHLLLIDDIVTTGATLIACGQEILKSAPAAISILALGFTKG